MHAALFTLAIVSALQSAPSTLRVSATAEFTTIGAAIQAAQPGDTVRVGAGVYAEPTLQLDKRLTLIAEPGAILDGEGERGLIIITADSVSVSGFTLKNTGITYTDDRAGVLVDKARFCSIRDNVILDTFFGIYLANAGDCEITGNDLLSHGNRETRLGNGIHLWYSTRIHIQGNRIRGHRDGIYFEFVEDTRVEDNDSRENLRYGLHFMFSDRCTYERNTFANNGAGVAVMYTRDMVMTDNDFDENLGSTSFGLLLKDITDSEVRRNRFRRNSVGIHAEGVNRVIVQGNDFHENGWAVKIMANSESSTFSENNFVGNSFDIATNSRRTYSEFDGNYWDRYRGFDRDGDGIGDVVFHPVRLFSLVVSQNEPALVLQRSPLIMLLDLVERVVPMLTPENLTDSQPLLTPFQTRWSH